MGKSTIKLDLSGLEKIKKKLKNMKNQHMFLFHIQKNNGIK